MNSPLLSPLAHEPQDYTQIGNDDLKITKNGVVSHVLKIQSLFDRQYLFDVRLLRITGCSQHLGFVSKTDRRPVYYPWPN